MGLFKSNIRQILQEFKQKTIGYSNDLSKEINESYEDLQAEYQESSNAVPEFEALLDSLKPKLDVQDLKKLESFHHSLSQINKTARNGVEAMRQLARNQRKISTETQWLYEEYEG